MAARAALTPRSPGGGHAPGRRSPFAVSVAALRRDADHRSSVVCSAAIGGLAITGSAVPDGSDVSVEVVVELVHGGVLVSGAVTAPWEGACRRCLGPARGVLRSKVRELFEENGDPEVVYRMGRATLDLEPLVRDAVLLDLPLAPLCRPGCAGLCPVCGANRNDTACTCERAERSRGPWSALDMLRDDQSR